MSLHVLPAPQAAPTRAPRQKHVLLIDDDQPVVAAIAGRLRQQGFDVSTADSGQQGLMLTRSSKPHVVLMDLRLPDADGRAICQQIVDSHDTCGIPVILLSGLEHPDIVRSCRAAGCHYFLRKPLDPNALLVLIRQAIADTHEWSFSDE